MAATSSPLAVQAALWALDQSGTAVDAALAADAVLGVVQPMSTGLGGDAFCLVDDGRDVVGFNGSGASPAALTVDACRAERRAADLDALGPEIATFMPGLPETSSLAVTVPGVADAWVQLAERYSRLGLDAILRPAIELARHGFPSGPVAAGRWRDNANRLRAGSSFPAVPRPGERVANPALADTLDAVARGGRDAHYAGSWARTAVDAVGAAGGVLDMQDLADHRGEWVEPIVGSYRGHEIVELPPNGSGAAVLAALAELDRDPAPRWPDDIGRVLAAVRRGMEQAYRHVADPRCVDVRPFWTDGDTVYTAVHANGMSVSLISSVSWPFGSGIVAGGCVIQNRGAGFTVEAGHPNEAGGGKRPFHTILPALVRRDGRPWAVLGVVGGPMQPQGQVQVISGLVDDDLDPQAALDRPRARWLGGAKVGLEGGWPPTAMVGLGRGDFEVVDEGGMADWGGGQAVRIHSDGWLQGGSDPRLDGVAFGR